MKMKMKIRDVVGTKSFQRTLNNKKYCKKVKHKKKKGCGESNTRMVKSLSKDLLRPLAWFLKVMTEV